MHNKVAIVLLNPLGSITHGFTNDQCLELLPFRGRPLIAETIYRLTQSGVRNFVVLHDKNIGKSALTSLRKTARWGTAMEFAAYDGPEQNTYLSKLSDLSEYSEIIISRGDLVWEKSFSSFQGRSEADVNIVSSRAPILEKKFPPFDDLEVSLGTFMKDHCGCVSHDEYVVKRIRGLNELYDANMRLHFIDLSTEDVFFEKAPGIFAKQGALIDTRSVANSELAVGTNSIIRPTAALLGKNIIGDSVYVDNYAKLENCFVFDGSYVGEGTIFRNCIINKNTVYDVGKDQCVTVLDECVLGNNSGDVFKTYLSKMKEYVELFSNRLKLKV